TLPRMIEWSPPGRTSWVAHSSHAAAPQIKGCPFGPARHDTASNRPSAGSAAKRRAASDCPADRTLTAERLPPARRAGVAGLRAAGPRRAGRVAPSRPPAGALGASIRPRGRDGARLLQGPWALAFQARPAICVGTERHRPEGLDAPLFYGDSGDLNRGRGLRQ